MLYNFLRYIGETYLDTTVDAHSAACDVSFSSMEDQTMTKMLTFASRRLHHAGPANMAVAAVADFFRKCGL